MGVDIAKCRLPHNAFVDTVRGTDRSIVVVPVVYTTDWRRVGARFVCAGGAGLCVVCAGVVMRMQERGFF
jgi:hypothetical protein